MSFFGKKKSAPPPVEDTTSIGHILVKMGACDLPQVAKAAADQAAATEEQRIGTYLIAAGIITAEALEAALLYQENLRSGSRHKQAIAESKIAQHQASGVIAFAHQTREAVTSRVSRIRHKTGQHHPAVAPMRAAKAAPDE
jgi:hypothetical protein